MEISGIPVPGLVKKVEVTGSAVIDAVTDDNDKTLGYQPNGYEPMKMTVDLLLEPAAGETFEELAKVVQFLFRPPGQAAAMPIAIVNNHAASHDISLVFCKSVSTSKKTESSYGEATLEFWEYLPVVVQTETASNTGSTAATSAEASTAGISTEYQEYLNTQRGQAPKIKSKTSESPAQDIM